ncbi:MAG: hypothetical protein EAX95_00070 [Candidatus Thorarchaeota archaeon]|nr:hypothetical protein [Candidatus Thorarchaeota archaeon]
MIRRNKKKQELEPPNPLAVLFEFSEEDEEYVQSMLKKSARRTLDRFKSEEPKVAKSEAQQEPLFFPELQAKISALEVKMGIHTSPPQPIRNCRKCYFASSFRNIQTNWYCRCTNVSRTPAKGRGLWILCESNLPCWRSP